MAPPQIFINTKALELEKRPENDNEDGDEDFEPEKKQEREGKKEEKDDNSDHKIEIKGSLPILSYIVVFTGLAIALLGVSFNENDGLLKYVSTRC